MRCACAAQAHLTEAATVNLALTRLYSQGSGGAGERKSGRCITISNFVSDELAITAGNSVNLARMSVKLGMQYLSMRFQFTFKGS